MGNDQISTGRRSPHGDKSILFFRMIRVVRRNAQRISKNGDRLPESNTVLSQVRSCLLRVPFEVYHISALLCRGGTHCIYWSADLHQLFLWFRQILLCCSVVSKRYLNRRDGTHTGRTHTFLLQTLREGSLETGQPFEASRPPKGCDRLLSPDAGPVG